MYKLFASTFKGGKTEDSKFEWVANGICSLIISLLTLQTFLVLASLSHNAHSLFGELPQLHLTKAGVPIFQYMYISYIVRCVTNALRQPIYGLVFWGRNTPCSGFSKTLSSSPILVIFTVSSYVWWIYQIWRLVFILKLSVVDSSFKWNESHLLSKTKLAVQKTYILLATSNW